MYFLQYNIHTVILETGDTHERGFFQDPFPAAAGAGAAPSGIGDSGQDPQQHGPEPAGLLSAGADE